MNFWHNNLDSVYNRPAKSIGVAIEVLISDSDSSSGVVEDHTLQLKAIGEILNAMATVLTVTQQGDLARMLRLRAAGDPE